MLKISHQTSDMQERHGATQTVISICKLQGIKSACVWSEDFIGCFARGCQSLMAGIGSHDQHDFSQNAVTAIVTHMPTACRTSTHQVDAGLCAVHNERCRAGCRVKSNS